MITKEKEMKISQTYRADSASQEPKAALRKLMQRLGLTFLACTLAVRATEAQQVAPPIAGVDGKVVAKKIIIFPPELSGAPEGSVLTDAPGATTHSTMTSGSVCRPAVSHS